MKHKGMDIFGEEDMMSEAPSCSKDQVDAPGKKDLKNPSAVSGCSDEGNEARLDHLPLKQTGKME
jgi:hypothetical protein